MTSVSSPLLAAETPGVRSLRQWQAVQLDAVRATLSDLLADWSADWCVQGESAQEFGGSAVSVSPIGDWPADDLIAHQWQLWQSEESGAVWWCAMRGADAQNQVRPALQQSLLDAMYGAGGREATPRGALAQQMAHEAWMDWCQRFAACFGIKAAEPSSALGELALPDSLTRPWSGALALQILLCTGVRILVVPDAQAVQQLCGECAAVAHRQRSDTAPALVPVAEALAPCAAWLSVELAPVDIGLGILASLRTGDVLRTTHRLDSPLRVLAHADPARHEGVLLCEAFLGKQDDQRGVELLSTPSGHGSH